MDKTTFITLQSEDIATLKNPAYNAILEGFKEYIPEGVDIPEDKSVAQFYSYMLIMQRKNKRVVFIV